MNRNIRNLAVLLVFAIIFPLMAGERERLLGAAQSSLAWKVTIEKLEPTVLFPRQPAGQALKQRAILHIDNPGYPVDAGAVIMVGDNVPYEEDLGTLDSGKSAIPISILDIAAPARVTVELRDKASSV